MISKVISSIMAAVYVLLVYLDQTRYPFTWARVFTAASAGFLLIWFAEPLGEAADARRNRPSGSSKIGLRCVGWFLLLLPAVALLLVKVCLPRFLQGP
jgi:hypothetical protein